MLDDYPLTTSETTRSSEPWPAVDALRELVEGKYELLVAHDAGRDFDGSAEVDRATSTTASTTRSAARPSTAPTTCSTTAPALLGELVRIARARARSPATTSSKLSAR